MNLIQKLKSGKPVNGTAFTSTAPSWPASLKKAALDFAFVDNEHIAMKLADLVRWVKEGANEAGGTMEKDYMSI